MPRSTTSLYLFLAIVNVAAGSACEHVPTAEERRLAAGQYDGALAMVHEADKAGIEGNVALSDMKYRQALKELLDAVKTDAKNPDAHYLLGMVYFTGFRRHDDATRELTTAIKLKADAGEEYPEAENLMGVVLVDAGRPREALPFFEKARTNLLYATPYYAEQEIGWAYYKLGQLDEARLHLRNALAAQPDLCGAYVKLAEVEQARADEPAVQTTLADFITRCDSDTLRTKVGPRLLSWAYFRLGMSRIKTGARDEGIDSLRQCIERFPTQPVFAECDRSLRALDGAGGPT